MIVAWRLDKAERSREESFSGEGARLGGGRWNHEGVRAVYASESLALAALEKFVHVRSEELHMALVFYRIEIPAPLKVIRLLMKDLPPNWDEEPAPFETMRLGTEWIEGGSAAVLRVPSVIVPTEGNFVLNPAHPDFQKLKIFAPEPFGFDPRMWK